MSVRPGGGSDGWLKPSKDGNSEALDCEFVVVDGPYAKRKLWQLFTLTGNTSGHTTAGDISRKTLRVILESARAIKPDDNSEAAQAARRTTAGWADFNDLRFMAQIGVRPPEGAFAAKNFIQQVITPEKACWKQVEQIPASDRKAYQAPTNGSGATPTANPATPTTSAPPAGGTIDRPNWAK
jgi:hypothetical protein